MKTIILSGYDVALLNKVSNSGHPFYSTINDFLDENINLPENESKDLIFQDERVYEFTDVVKMIDDYLNDDSMSEDDFPSISERNYLKDFLEKIKMI